MNIHQSIIREIIKESIGLYDNSIQYPIRIYKTNFKPGSGDYEDSPEIQNDSWGEFYEVEYGDQNNQTSIGFSGGGWYDSLSEAIAIVEVKNNGVVWK